jgi:hypothetical protein
VPTICGTPDVVGDGKNSFDRQLQEALGAAVVARIGSEFLQRQGRERPQDAHVAREQGEQLIDPRAINHG